jgi:hypothetical protein
LSGKRKEKEKSGHGPKGVPDTKTDRPTDLRPHHRNATWQLSKENFKEKEKLVTDPNCGFTSGLAD